MSKTRKQLEDIWEEVHELGMPSGELVDEWAKVVNFALAQTETLITRQMQEAEARARFHIRQQLGSLIADYPKGHKPNIELGVRSIVELLDQATPTPTATPTFDTSQVSLCPNCGCMTHTIDGMCGKCGDAKGTAGYKQ